MRLASLNEVIRGKLINSPIVTSVKNFVFDPKKVTRGDCFFAYDLASLSLAAENGAYAVVFAHDVGKIESEIAYIKVDSLDDALMRVLRYLIVEKEPTIYTVNNTILQLARNFIKDSRLVLISDAKKAILSLQSYQSSWLYMFDNVLEEAVVTVENLPTAKIEIIRSTVQESSVIVDGKIEEIQLSALFLGDLKIVYGIAKKHQLNFFLHSKELNLSRFNIIKIHNGQKLLITDETDDEDIALDFISSVAPWAKIFIPTKLDLIDLAKELKSGDFQYAYLNRVDKENLIAVLESLEYKSLSLFGD